MKVEQDLIIPLMDCQYLHYNAVARNLSVVACTSRSVAEILQVGFAYCKQPLETLRPME